MSNESPSDASGRRGYAKGSTSIGLIGVVLFFFAGGIGSYWNVHILNHDSELVAHTNQVLAALGDLGSLMKDAETGQRGYVITGTESYLEPYNAALRQLGERTGDLERLTDKDQVQQARLQDMKSQIHLKLQELGETISLRKNQGFNAALATIQTDRGKIAMDALRADIDLTQQDERVLRDSRIAEMEGAYRFAVIGVLVTALLGMILTVIVAVQMQRASSAGKRQEWLQTGQVGLSAAMSGEQRLEQLAESILKFSAEYLDAQAAAFFGKGGEGYQRLATYGLAANSNTPDRFMIGDGLLGQAAKDKRTFQVRDVPEGYLTVTSALGSCRPRHLIVVPATVDQDVNAILEYGFIQPPNELTVELLARGAGAIGMAVRSAYDRANLQDLLEETQRQGEELQSQTEELRITNEEVVAQRDDLTLTKGVLEVQAKDLERTIRFKSEFLANMSHELRTPLNSALILSKLLGDNREGNLTAEQVKYARTIQSSGNDLLVLIGDILDLSKIEAGHMEVNVQKVHIDEVVERISRTFAPIAGDKGLEFNTTISTDAPRIIETDSQRLEQVLKNLLSNAMKFTEDGRVSLAINSAQVGFITFSVNDSGIGIAADQQEMVFEAFRQADGTTSRKYGGTGLGLSISRQLSHLLGGEIVLTSEPGQGCTFALTIPSILGKSSSRQTLLNAPKKFQTAVRESPNETRAASVPMVDDREALASDRRVILVVEDDEKFARILYNLTREHGFQCLIAVTGEEALALAFHFLPSAVLLDVGLPDQSGLSVLDVLKHDVRTRHIPVHIVSGADNAKTAMAMGAVGYLLKPVRREEIIQAFAVLESKLNQRMRRVLVVEDDAVQRDSLRLLLTSRDVETVGVGTAAACLDILHTETFDCMVLDLGLPDASGFSILGKLSEEDEYSFPPVIVYTGKELSTDEEQQLRKYSKSIIVKGAKSPERLLDEVTLFVHRIVADLPVEEQRLIEQAKDRDSALEGRVILIVEDDVRNIFALTGILEPRGAKIEVARNGREAIELLERTSKISDKVVDLVLMDIMMPVMDGFAAMREIRKRPDWTKLPIIALTAKAMKSDQAACLDAGASDYIAKPLDVEKLLSLIHVWMPSK